MADPMDYRRLAQFMMQFGQGGGQGPPGGTPPGVGPYGGGPPGLDPRFQPPGRPPSPYGMQMTPQGTPVYPGMQGNVTMPMGGGNLTLGAGAQRVGPGERRDLSGYGQFNKPFPPSF
jgi:hypothetical protein